MKNSALLLVVAFVFTAVSASSLVIPPEWVTEAVGWFEGALQIDSCTLDVTSTPPMQTPGREGELVAYLKAILDEEEIMNIVIPLPLSATISQPLLLAFLSGEEGYGDVLLASHSDTVGIGRMDPELVFSGETIDGYLYGRGAMDMKQKVVMDLITVVWLNRLEVPLKRGIIYGVFPGEEVGLLGAAITAMVPELAAMLVNVSLVLDEGGGMTVDVLGKTFMPVAIGEKGGCPFDLVVEKDDGHATNYLPMEDSALFTMAEALINAAKTISIPHYTAVNSMMLDEIENAVDNRYKNLVKDLKTPAKFERSIRRIIDNDPLGAKFLLPQLVNLFNAVRFHSYTWETLTPGRAEAKVGFITIPGDMMNCINIETELSDALGNSEVQITRTQLTGMSVEQGLAFGAGVHVNPNDANVARMMSAIEGSAAVHAPQVKVIHSMFQAISDCMVFTNYMGKPCIGFEPTIMFPGEYFLDYFHSNNERIPLQGWITGVKLYVDAIDTYTTSI